jgi:hypothetical protein
MAKKKKKSNLHAQQKAVMAQHKKLYIERLRKLCSYISNDEPLFDILPYYVQRAIYEIRGVTLKIKVDKDVKITKRFVKILYCHLESEMKEKYIDLMIPGLDKKINLVDYYQVILPLETILSLKVCAFSGKEKFNNFCMNMNERYDRYEKTIMQIIHEACSRYCDLSKHSLYTFSYDVYRTTIDSEAYCGLYYQVITIGIKSLNIRHVDIRGNRRPVVQVGEINYYMDFPYLNPTTVSLRQLYIKDPSGNNKIPVYIQQHAVDRIMQRACCVAPGLVPSLIHNAFINKNRILVEGDRYLIECYMDTIKIGYLVGMLVDKIFVILTFLLITHSSTPEGRKLSKLTGLQRDDMSFLAIDDLKTLVNSDITQDPRIAKIFIDAGCESILQMNYDLHTKGSYYWMRDDTKQDTELSKLIAEYIQLGASDEEYFENE